MDLALHSAPTIRTSVTVSTDLRVEVFYGESVVRNYDVLVPEKMCDLKDLKRERSSNRLTSTAPSEKASHLLRLVSTLREETSGKHFACKL